MRRVICLVSHYLPGYKAGGALRSVANLARLLREQCVFDVVTSDRDVGDSVSYESINPGGWTSVNGSRVRYVSRRFREIADVVYRCDADVLYLNSFFGFCFSIFPVVLLTLRGRGRTRIVIAPRGEFSEGALTLKKWKKDIFIRICRRCGVYRNIVWHASTELEALDIRRTLGPLASDIRVALDVSLPPQRTEGGISFLNVDRLPLKICFISRISRKKNLHYALQVLNRVTANVVFNVYGPCEDEVYMAECASMSVGMPPNVRVNYCGPLEYSLVSEMLASHHLFFFPTLGENFGHVIAESLAAGTPVLVSDQTPWRNLNQYGAGWDFSLADPSVFSDAIERVSGMRAADYLAMRRCAETYTLGLGVDRARDDMLICLFETMAA